MEAPSGLGAFSPQGFHELSKGFQSRRAATHSRNKKRAAFANHSFLISNQRIPVSYHKSNESAKPCSIAFISASVKTPIFSISRISETERT